MGPDEDSADSVNESVNDGRAPVKLNWYNVQFGLEVG
jgi:hypothetical protein